MRLTVDRALFEPASSEEAAALLDLFITVQRAASALQQVPPFHALLTDPLYKPVGDNGPLDHWLAARPPSERERRSARF
ncbi:Hypothetical protein CAP_1949 [Chondromyces apiculatus DSM 436]|uniref:Uncharacterized protein n=1 Tax=Chondromyces apiculatus DSM 436 TaxID=1192034 RepID=A0A017TB01_9BACT|nr:Hypothetical protein CAP_1949 [Chondromyces apiculatus DSM 436]